MKAIVNAKVVLPDRLVEDGVILMEGDRIQAVGSAKDIPLPADCEKIDAKGQVAGPGFVDIHCHAGGAYWAYDDPVKMAQHHLEGGTTSLDCTIFHDIGIEGAHDAMRKIRAAYEANTPGNIMGIHFEGPFLNRKYGASAKTARPVDRDEYMKYIELAGDLMRLWTFAPELPGTDQFIEDVQKVGIPMAMGHTEASPERVFECAAKGVSVCTHLTNATGCSIYPTRYGGTREVPFDEAIMLCDNVFCEIIHDARGVHVRPTMIKLILKTIGIDRMVAVTDACTGALDDDDINIVNGELYGSKLRMYQVARNFKNNLGMNEVDIFKICSRNPSRAVKMDGEVGTLEVGKKANVVIVDPDYSICKVILNGNVAVDNK